MSLQAATDWSHMEQNRRMSAGDDKEIEIVVYPPDDDVTPRNLSGFTAEWGLYSHSGVQLIVKAAGSGAEITDAPNGVVTITLEPADTLMLNDSYYHELDVVDSSSKRATVAGGYLQVAPKRT